MNSSFFSKTFQNATFPYLTTFSQLARVYNRIWSKKLFHIDWLKWQTKTLIEDTEPIRLEVIQSRQLYHTKQTVLILQISRSGVFSLEPV